MRLIQCLAMAMALGAGELLGASVAAQTRIGIVASVNPNVVSAAPGQAARLLTIGDMLQAGERISTGGLGHVTLLFVDGGALDVGPDSEIAIERFAFDRNSGQGEMTVALARGLIRLAGGKIGKNNAVELRTPGAVIALRGGIVLLRVAAEQELQAVLLFGDRLEIRAAGATETATRPGTLIEMRVGQSRPSTPRLATDFELQELSRQLQPAAEFTSAAGSDPPQAVRAAKATMPLDLRDTAPWAVEKTPIFTGPPHARADAAMLPPQQYFGRFVRGPAGSVKPYLGFDVLTLAAPPDPNNNFPITATVIGDGSRLRFATPQGIVDLPYPSGGADFVGAGGQFFYADWIEDDGARAEVIAFGGVPTTTLPASGFGAHAMVSRVGQPPFVGDLRWLPPGRNAAISPLYSVYSPNISPMAIDAAINPFERAVHLQASLAIAGTGLAQTSFLIGETGGYFHESSNGTTALFSSGVLGSYRETGEHRPTQLYAPLSSAETPSGNAIYGPDGRFIVLVPELLAVEPSAAGNGRLAGARLIQPFDDLAGADGYFVQVAVGGPSDAIGSNRTTQTLSGFLGGMIETRSATRAFGETPLRGTATITTDASSNRLVASFDFNGSHNLAFGGTNGAWNGTSSFVDDAIFAARDSVDRKSTVNGEAAPARLLMVTADTVRQDAVDGIAPCACRFMRWGWWLGEIMRADDARDRVHLATWVAGVAPAKLPTSGTANYTGHAIGNVVNDSVQYIAAGQYTQTWNFASHAGTIAIDRFDRTTDRRTGINLIGQALGVPGQASFTAQQLIGTPGFVGVANGGFFRGASDPAAGVGGNFAINGPNYIAVGTFAAQK